jgi:hypothetical protein
MDWHAAWHPLYRVGAVAAVLYVTVLLTAIGLDSVAPPPATDAAGLLEFIGEHRAIYAAAQVLWIVPGYLMVLVYLALGVALAPVGRTWALLAGVLGALPQALSLAIPVSTRGSLVLVTLSDRYLAAEPGRQAAIEAAAEGVIAENGTVALPGPLMAVGLLVAAIAMTRGVFPALLGWLGVVAGTLGLAAELLRFVVPSLYLASLLQWVWLVWTALVLLRLGGRSGTTASPRPGSEAGRDGDGG